VNRLEKRAFISSKRVSARLASVASLRELSRWRREITRALSDRSRASEENFLSCSCAVVSAAYAYAATGTARRIETRIGQLLGDPTPGKRTRPGTSFASRFAKPS
jgi:hypothetical protein